MLRKIIHFYLLSGLCLVSLHFLFQFSLKHIQGFSFHPLVNKLATKFVAWLSFVCIVYKLNFSVKFLNSAFFNFYFCVQSINHQIMFYEKMKMEQNQNTSC